MHRSNTRNCNYYYTTSKAGVRDIAVYNNGEWESDTQGWEGY